MAQVNYNIFARYLAANDIGKAVDFARVACSAESTEIAEVSARIASILKQLYEKHFAATKIIPFLAAAKRAIGDGPFCETISAAISDDLEFAAERREDLKLIYRERLAREIRDTTRAKDNKAAVRNAVLLINSATSEEEKVTLGGYVGSLLGSLENDQAKAVIVSKALSANAAQFKFSPQITDAIEEQRSQRLVSMYKSRTFIREVEFNTTINGVVRDMLKHLPITNDMHEPNDTNLAEFRRLIAGFFNAFFFFKNKNLLYDISLLLVEFCPKDTSLAAISSGVEQRLFHTLGVTARKTVESVLAEFGKNKIVKSLYMDLLSSSIKSDKNVGLVIEVAGSLRNLEFLPVFKTILKEKKLSPYRKEAIVALSYLGDKSVIDLLLNSLKETLKKKPIDSIKKRQAALTLGSLSKILSTPDLAPEMRNKIIKHALGIVTPINNTQLTVSSVISLFPINSEGVDQKYVKESMRVLIRGLWAMDTLPNFAESLPGQTNPLSAFRIGIVNVILRMGKEGLPHFLREIQTSPTKLSGAYLAYCEVLKRLGDESCLDTMEKLVQNALLAPEKAGYLYGQEKVYDAAEGVSKEITRDYVVSALLETVKTIGGIQGRQILTKIFKQIQSGRLPSPGKDSVNVLMTAEMSAAREAGDGGTIFSGAGVGLSDGGKSGATNGIPTTKLLKQLKAGGLFKNPAKIKRINALRELGNRKDPATIQNIINCLGEKDKMICAAAVNALLEYADLSTQAKVFEKFVNSLVVNLKNDKRSVRDGIVKIIHQINPSRQPILSKLRFLVANEKGDAAETVRKILYAAGVSLSDETPTGISSVSPFKTDDTVDTTPVATAEEQGIPSISEGRPKDHLSGIEQRRKFLKARQEWTRAGKQGPEPKLQNF